jgi:peptide/nickel transport system substrate-binding protein
MFVRVNNHFLVKVPAHGGSLREGLIGLPRTINPVLAITDVDRDISALVYAGLMKYTDGELIPDLAQSYTISEDGLVYAFTLKDNLTFHDGTKLTTDDIAFTIQKIQEPNLKSPRRPDWTNISVQVKSPTQITFTLKQPYSPFLSNTTIGILPKHVWGALNDNEFIFSNYNIEPIGAGPYKIVDVIRDSSIPSEYRLSTWRTYHGQRPYISSLIFNFFSDENKAVEALENGSIESLPSISAISGSQLASRSSDVYSLISEPLPRIFGVFFNQNSNPVLSEKVVVHSIWPLIANLS